MKKFSFLFVSLMILLMVVTGCSNDSSESSTGSDSSELPQEITVLAAASLKDALEEINTSFEAEHNVKVTYVFDSSGTLQKQIQEGAPANVFVSASQSHMNALEEDNLIDVSTRKDLLGNKLTLIVSEDKIGTINSYEDLTSEEVTRIAIGEPETVPAGNYAKTSFESLNIWDDLESKLVFGKNVRQVLTYVETGEAEAGLVYRTDALLIDEKHSISDMPEGSHAAIVYPSAILEDSKDNEGAKLFYEYLGSATASGVFEKFGFTVY